MRSALGKGLNALISDDTAASVTALTNPPVPTTLPISRIHPNPKQPRRHFSNDAITELALSIKERGVLQPILVSTTPGGDYEIIAGERRWRAAQQAGLTDIPALVKDGTEGERFQMALIENVQREDLNAIEQALGYKRLQEEFSMTQEQIAQVIGKDRAVVANLLRLLNLPDAMQQAVIDQKLTAGHARALVAVEDPAAREALFAKIIDEQLTVRDVEQAAREHKGVNVREHLRVGGYDARPPEVKAIEEDLQRALARKVQMQISGPSSQKGWIRLEFYSLDDLDSLIAQLNRSVRPG